MKNLEISHYTLFGEKKRSFLNFWKGKNYEGSSGIRTHDLQTRR